MIETKIIIQNNKTICRHEKIMDMGLEQKAVLTKQPATTNITDNKKVNEIYELSAQTIRKKLSLFVWQGFFESLSPVSFDGQIFTINAPSSFHRDWVKDHYKPEIIDAISTTVGKPVKINIICQNLDSQNTIKLQKNIKPIQTSTQALQQTQIPTQKPAKVKTTEERQEKLHTTIKNDANKHSVLKALTAKDSKQNQAGASDNKLLQETYRLNHNNTFDSFICGHLNQMVYSACMDVAQNPGKQYSPLFLFGDVGLGKTHLLHAIGNKARENNPKVRIIYLSSEQWVNAYVKAICEKKFDSFRKKFRYGCDLLLVDDIQFLAGKDASQDEFFHTFNALHQANKQIVVTSDKYPHEIEGMADRLQTRLSWGLIADIRTPEIAARRSIIKNKGSKYGLKLTDEISSFLATHLRASIREVEGALIRLSAYSKMSNSDLTLAKVKEYLSPLIKKSLICLTIEDVCQSVASYYDLKISDLTGKSRKKQVVLARQMAISLCRFHLTLSLPEIGRFFGGRDHSTILASLNKIEYLRSSDVGVQTVITKIEKTMLNE